MARVREPEQEAQPERRRCNRARASRISACGYESFNRAGASSSPRFIRGMVQKNNATAGIATSVVIQK